MSDKLKGKIAVVTGSGQGIGRAIAIAMAKEGAKLVTNNRRPGSTPFAILDDSLMEKLGKEQREQVQKMIADSTGDAETTAQTIRDMGGEAAPFFGDVSDFKIAAKLIQTAVDSFGRIDILVNVAGPFRFSPVQEMSEETWDYVTLSKPKSYFNCIRHAAPHMINQKWGRIINCTSRAWLGGRIKQCNYSAANAGVVGLTRAVAKELNPYGITCNAFAPDAWTRATFEAIGYAQAVDKSKNPFMSTKAASALENTESPDKIAPFIAYLATDKAANISGTVFFLKGSTIGIYSEPELIETMSKDKGTWTVDELIEQVPKKLLKGYQSQAVITSYV